MGTGAKKKGNSPALDWEDLRPGTRLSIVKLSPTGAEAARYPGIVAACLESERWWIVQATWTSPLVELDGVSFCPGDLLLEWFSPDHPFNAFAAFAPDGAFRGWYANVARAYLEASDTRTGLPVLVWHDYYLDLVGLPDGTHTIRDRDELEASGLESRNPALYREIVDAGSELASRFVDGRLPFLAVHAMAGFREVPEQRKNHP